MEVFVWIYWDHSGHLHLQYQKVRDDTIYTRVDFFFFFFFLEQLWMSIKMHITRSLMLSQSNVIQAFLVIGCT